MAKYELKTRASDDSVTAFLDGIADTEKRADANVIIDILRKVTNAEPKMWGGSIVGFGSYHYTGKGGGEGDWFIAGMSPRKQNLTLYMLGGWTDETQLTALGRHSLGKGCLYIKRLADVDRTALERLIASGVEHARSLLDADQRLSAGAS